MADTQPATRRQAREQRPVQQKRFVVPVPVIRKAGPPHHATGVRAATRSGLRPDIEGLRAVSILLVVLYHAGLPHLPGGYVGVDVFFVISGFLITSHLVRSIETGTMSLAGFYARRALRLLPAATLVIAATLAATWYWAPATRLKGISWDSIAANLYFINYRLAEVGTDYRNASALPSPLQHFWSLAVEEQFYLLIPLLLMGIGLLRRRAAFVIVLTLITAASLAWSVLYTESSATWAYFSTTSRAWELGAGAILAVTVTAFDRVHAPTLYMLRWAGIGAITYAALTFDEATPFPSYWAAIPVAGAVAVIAAGQINPDEPLLGNSLFQWIGARSYSWYLWHWPVLTLAPYILHRENLDLSLRLGCVALALGLAWFTYEVLEHPMRSNRDLRANPIAAFRFAGILTVLVLTFALALPYAPARVKLGSGVAAELDGPTTTKAVRNRVSAAAKVDLLPLNLTPALIDAPNQRPVTYTDHCHLGYPETQTPSRCEQYGEPGATTLVAVFGDSHATQWFSAMQALATENHWRLANFTKAGCSPASITMYEPTIKGAYTACDTWREASINRLRQLKPAMIVMSSGLHYGSDDQTWDSYSDDSWDEGFTTTVDRLRTSATNLVYLNDTPWPIPHPLDCLANNAASTNTCARPYKSAIKEPLRVREMKLMKSLNVQTVEPATWFCTKKLCPPVIGNHLVYMDSSHITPQYASALAPVLGDQLPGTVLGIVRAAADTTVLPTNITPALDKAKDDTPVTYEDGCHLAFEGTSTPRECERYGDKKSKTVVALFGDSHAAQWFPALEKLAQKNHWRLANYTKSACSAATITMYLDANKGAYSVCDAWRQNTIERLRKTKPALVVTTSNYGARAVGIKGDADTAWAAAWKQTVRDLDGLNLVYLNDTPWPKGNAPDCLVQHAQDTHACARSYASATASPRRGKVATMMASQDIPVINPMSWFCTFEICPPVVGDLLVYMDQSHISPEYARLLAPLLQEQLHVPAGKSRQRG